MMSGRFVIGLSFFFMGGFVMMLIVQNYQTMETVQDTRVLTSNHTSGAKNDPNPVCKVDFTNVYSMDLTTWSKNNQVCSECQNFIKATLKTPYGNTPIFVYPLAQDGYVSGLLISSGHFEAETSSIMLDLLNSDPKLNLIDIGANIGVFTLSAAKMGRKVLAVEALDRNIRHICTSVAEGGLQDKVTLVHNAISNSNGVANLGVHKNNMGGTFVDIDSDHIKKLKAGGAQGTYGTVHTIKMDDLLKIPGIENFQNVVVKMDIEGFEAKAIEGASLFFEKIKIVGFIMEWVFHRKQKSADTIIKLMSKHNFIPHSLSSPKQKLDYTKSDSWGNDVLWLPKG
ncbi:unnamed protein product [Mytilus coruscus]|uniref:Methyltransferase FkbM domain-containing protein n=1 Tax=Mytilus coruscus TaxID=42192 RepID=A0A6J8C6Z8_MYTCO|nr:unnamed protein product [Mytilus coruscus]